MGPFCPNIKQLLMPKPVGLSTYQLNKVFYSPFCFTTQQSCRDKFMPAVCLLHSPHLIFRLTKFIPLFSHLLLHFSFFLPAFLLVSLFLCGIRCEQLNCLKIWVVRKAAPNYDHLRISLGVITGTDNQVKITLFSGESIAFLERGGESENARES